MKKLSLNLERLAVTSFSTSAAEEGRGTVRAAADDCTCARSCACPSAYFYCNTNPVNTIYSCQYTANASCWYSKGCTPA
ncbi:hypothetical protein [Longimicrobium sp.]|uniref:hypothetical protein n=1 Tax=Longimicrobium sp. TaxID=2029185 RepID=UPI002C5B49D9|nr:hypothetical protein [Longimicrobium sp.]HSU15091.1 hypothetical protein [Longimicrobium sp.]